MAQVDEPRRQPLATRGARVILRQHVQRLHAHDARQFTQRAQPPTAREGRITPVHWVAPGGPAASAARPRTGNARNVADRKFGSALIVLVTGCERVREPAVAIVAGQCQPPAIPAGTPTPSTSTSAAIASSIVRRPAGSAMTRETGSPVTKDLPNSSRATLAT